ncbi:MAG: hypothetical protein NT062_17375 [Proteobacteria bacterium]|nr:hypothetical protein [Pseudomonadota bacterium]
MGRSDTLAGRWWLIQPVTPAIDPRALAARLGLGFVGFLPPSILDVPGRVVMACREQVPMDPAIRSERLSSNPQAAGWLVVNWRTEIEPLSDPGFELVTVAPPDGQPAAGLPTWPVTTWMSS